MVKDTQCRWCGDSFSQPARGRSHYCSVACKRKAHNSGARVAYQQWISEGVRASCHTDKPHYSKGLCEACYVRRPGYKHGILPEIWAAYVGAEPSCDLCGAKDAGHSTGWRIDHAHGHGCRKRTSYVDQRGCIDCVRANLCHRCNQAEGFVVELMARGLVTQLTGPLMRLLGPIEDTPFQRWRRQQA